MDSKRIPLSRKIPSAAEAVWDYSPSRRFAPVRPIIQPSEARMRRCGIVVRNSLAVALGLAVWWPLTTAAQSGGAERARVAATTAAAGAATGTPRTPWGEPDLQGVWTSEPELGVPFERAVEYGEREELTEQEFASRQNQAQRQLQTDNAEFDLETAETANAGAVGSATSPPPHWLERGRPSRRTSMVILPKNGRSPPQTPEARKRGRGVAGSFGNGPFNSPADFTLYDRCITRGVPNAMFPAIYNANTQIVQGPGVVAITYEMIHETRVVPIGSQPPLNDRMRQWLGDARGHWEGDTLVVESTHFTDRTSYRGAGAGLRLVERFTRVDGDDLRYEVTVDDPTTWTMPWTAALNMKPQAQGMFEYACHEGNNSMRNMLSAARAAESPAAAPKK
jgi:hypothetical protein